MTRLSFIPLALRARGRVITWEGQSGTRKKAEDAARETAEKKRSEKERLEAGTGRKGGKAKWVIPIGGEARRNG